jgi:hypothetical protein
MIKLFYKLFKKQILAIQYLEQSKKPGLEKLEYKFRDSKGRAYYAYPNDLDLPLKRKGEMERVLLEIEAGISKSELDLIVDSGIAAINRVKDGRPAPDLGTVLYLFHEMKIRKDILIHPELLFEAVAIMYIREDEDPAVVDKEILNEKIEQFKLDSKDGLYDFFYRSGINTFMPYLEKSQEEWMEYYSEGKAKAEALKSQLKSILEGEYSNT